MDVSSMCISRDCFCFSETWRQEEDSFLKKKTKKQKQQKQQKTKQKLSLIYLLFWDSSADSRLVFYDVAL